MPTTKISTNSILSKLKIKSLNEMQLASIEAIDKNNNVLLLSATGSGKTLGLPVTAAQIIKPGEYKHTSHYHCTIP
jgi:Lhr-like helicase